MNAFTLYVIVLMIFPILPFFMILLNFTCFTVDIVMSGPVTFVYLAWEDDEIHLGLAMV